MTLMDFTLSNTRRFYSSMGNPLAVEGLTTSKYSVPTNKVKYYVPTNALTAIGALMTLMDFTLC